MTRLDQRILQSQVDVFVEWGRRYNISSSDHRRWLEIFLQNTDKTDILDVTEEDRNHFLEIVKTKTYSQHDYNTARKAIDSLMRYYSARTKNGKRRDTRGRPPHIGNIKRVQTYRKKGLTFRDISKLVDRPVSLVHRWAKYPLNREDE